ncbi:hypothetical protein A2V54_03540 [candidate division WWE3 bacterium RBG_19FT_COMBO_53_11]|uniref:Thioredoxin domain-containing protein n=1 Tax=candidate division WWE3 bacterium RBG_19FT_COMBO_53_11 TaxID=1802613 RepID=A0A1F4UHP3_UNCKA|nr:MAG: hypothetical protein A2155_00080 [candidate division WWE3 bacterium RBG_16_52_45]OGC44422.1 MAG: hypothetical protein A2V54_03540 [candidate division WWE3 bacterium RBG_19FT_COMBO_53_11]
MDPNLARLLEEDPMGKLFAAAEEASRPFTNHLAQQYPRVKQALEEAHNSPEMRAKLNFSTEAHMRLSAAALGVTYEELKGYFDLSQSMKEGLTARRREAVRYSTLRRSGAALLHRAPVIKIRHGKLLNEPFKPYIVLFSTGWCFWCQLVKPTFARLAYFFDRCELLYCKDEELAKAEGVRFFPQLVAYFPGGIKVRSECGNTTRELWNNLNLLITLGRGFAEREGTLVCSDGECRVESAD